MQGRRKAHVERLSRSNYGVSGVRVTRAMCATRQHDRAERPEEERWTYETDDGRADFEGEHVGAVLWADDGLRCRVRLYEFGGEVSPPRLPLGIEVEAEDGSADATSFVSLTPTQAEQLAEDLEEYAADIREIVD